MRKKLAVTTVLVALAALTVACGGGGSEPSSGGGPTLSIASPSDGDSVSAPFDLELSTEAELGSPESGNNHVHVFYDGNEDEYEVVEESTFTVSDLPAGEHTIGASLRNADHSPAGAEVAITVTIGGGGGGTEGEDDEGGPGGGGY